MPVSKTPPDQVYGSLFEAVQLGGIFEDSKTFVDSTARMPPSAIVSAFEARRGDPSFDLESFVREHFDVPGVDEKALQLGHGQSLRRHIDEVWQVLHRAPDRAVDHSTLIPLPHAYVVPGGRFREIYYWDSYFTMLGLAASGRTALIRSMVDNFAYLIEQVGFVPNGNRSYYCSRSQPPLFAAMLNLLANVEGRPEAVLDYLAPLEAEYRFWMTGTAELENGAPACRRVVSADGAIVNRYWDELDRPRPESYAEDLRLAGETGARRAGFFRNIRAACESGWDFSSRWLADPDDNASIRTTQVIPVDLNAILFQVETTLAGACELAGRDSNRRDYQARADARRHALQKLFFDAEAGQFVDLHLPTLEPTGCRSLAAAFPLFFGAATEAQAEHTSRTLEREFLRPGGWTTTLRNSGQQWDAPNGWAPLHWVVFAGLNRYGFADHAAEGARRWVANNRDVFEKTGRLLEKYNVEQIGAFSGGGEYEVQHGFGWTNGVLLSLMDALGDTSM